MVISVLNLKGGTGKSTISTNLAVLFSKRFNTLLIDSDLQGTALNWYEQRQNNNTTDSLSFSHITEPEQLKYKINTAAKNYDVIIIDGSPAIDLVNAVSIAKSDFILIPVNSSILDLWSVKNLVKRIKAAKELKPNLTAAFCVNRDNLRTSISKEMNEALGLFNLPVLTSRLTNRIAYIEAFIFGLSVVEYKDNKARYEIETLFNELLTIIEKAKK